MTVRARTPAQRAGDAAESHVAGLLQAAGWQVLGSHVRAGRSELDIVAIDPGPPRTLVVVEVRWRAGRAFGLPEETLDHAKRAHLRTGLARLLAAGHLPDGARVPALPVRVDLVVVEPSGGRREAPRTRHYRAVEL